MTKRIVILGTGGNCIDILDALLEINRSKNEPIYECIGFLDDNPAKLNQSFHGVSVLGNLQMAREIKECSFVFGIGSVSNFWKRKDILSKLKIEEDRFEIIIHPTASVSQWANIGQGTVIFQNAVVTSNAKIGSYVMILPNSIISHDDLIGDFTCVAGGVSISGNVKIGESCYVGANASIKEGIEIGKHCLIGMGSVVLNNVSENSIMVGNPAKFLRNVS
ncbi:MAG: acetyltransferase [Anaerolineales bacterium]|nr:acetyltransferase [Anaerolineales bacterium]